MSTQPNRRDLSNDERILRIQDEWNQIAREPAGMELTSEQLAELERRLQDHRRNPRRYATWEEVRAELETLGRRDPD